MQGTITIATDIAKQEKKMKLECQKEEEKSSELNILRHNFCPFHLEQGGIFKASHQYIFYNLISSRIIILDVILNYVNF